MHMFATGDPKFKSGVTQYSVSLVFRLDDYIIILARRIVLHEEPADSSQVDWHLMVLDEAQKIRNPNAQVTLAVKRFPCWARVAVSPRAEPRPRDALRAKPSRRDCVGDTCVE